MNRWDVVVTEERVVTLTVEADSWLGAREAAIEAYKAAPVPGRVRYSADPLRAHGEPWVTLPEGGFYDLHGPREPHVVVGERAYGFTFTKREVALLAARIADQGYEVVEQWNGDGCRSVSYRIGNRRGGQKMTPDQVAAIAAPRPWRDAP